jgi:hypothetical protein
MNIAAAAAASIQALAEALQQQHINQPPQQRITLPTFWKEDPRGWFHHIEAEFTIARVPLTSYHCYLHIIRALPADIIAAVHDLIRTITEETPNAYEVIKAALLRRFTATPLQQSHKLLDYAQLGDGNIAVHYAQMRALYTPNSDVLFNAIFLRTLPENVRTALASQAELPSDELAHAAIQLQHTVVPTASIAAATPIAAASPAPPPAGETTSSRLTDRDPTPTAAAHTAGTPAPAPPVAIAAAAPPAATPAAAAFAGTTSLLVREPNTATTMNATGKTRKGSGGHHHLIINHRHLVVDHRYLAADRTVTAADRIVADRTVAAADRTVATAADRSRATHIP